MIHLRKNDAVTFCDDALGRPDEFTNHPSMSNCPYCLEAYYDETDAETIDVNPTRYAHPEGIKTTPADIVGNYILGRTIAKGSKASRVIDYHMKQGSRHSLTAVLEDGQAITLYMPTKFEIVPSEILGLDHNIQPAEQSAFYHEFNFWLLLMCGCAVLGWIAGLASVGLVR